MRPTSVITSMLLLALLAGCAATNPTTIPVKTTTTGAAAVDLNDPATQAALGSPPPDGVVWERSVGDLTVLGLTAAADPGEMTLLTTALTDVPAPLLAHGTPRFLVRVADIAGAETLTSAVTLTLGPDIYLLDRTFTGRDRPISRLDLTYALAHELAHVAQWFSLDDDYVRGATAGRISNIQLDAGSSVVRDFATAVDWIDESQDADQPDWQPTGGPAPTAYAGTNPVEDLAESVALVTVGRGNWIDQTRLDWITNWLGVSEEDLSAGNPWVPAGSEEVLPTNPLFDESLAADLAESMGAVHIEPASFVLPPTDGPTLVGEIQQQLGERGLAGTFGSVAAEGFPRYRGTFAGDDGVVFLVELWDLTLAAEGEEAVLTYVAIW
ncbi:MAG: hypothetical protein P1T08_03020 [Acidimicrobiia bacterium]|nr:hypothetical protein [Acidimicrobiia bacterium]